MRGPSRRDRPARKRRSTIDAVQAKADLRLQIKSTLEALGDDERHERSRRACDKLVELDAFRHARTIMLYMPLRTELDVTSAAIRCYQTGKTVCVPKVDWERREMCAVEAHSIDDNVMDPDVHGVRVPRATRPIPPDMIDLIVVPGLAFDATGRRLGRGGGYYDRFLDRIAHRNLTTIGIGYDVQIVDTVPAEPHDLSVDLVVTDRRVARGEGLRRG